jgi:Fe-S-cluster containining protein
MKWKDNTKNGECSNCGKCCTNILLLTADEITKIKKFINFNKIKPVNRNNFLTSYVDICPFLSNDKKCLIYEVRPQICQNFICKTEYDDKFLNYKQIKAINMLKTFFPNEYCEDVDLTEINNRLRNFKKNINTQ